SGWARCLLEPGTRAGMESCPQGRCSLSTGVSRRMQGEEVWAGGGREGRAARTEVAGSATGCRGRKLSATDLHGRAVAPTSWQVAAYLTTPPSAFKSAWSFGSEFAGADVPSTVRRPALPGASGKSAARIPIGSSAPRHAPESDMAKKSSPEKTVSA